MKTWVVALATVIGGLGGAVISQGDARAEDDKSGVLTTWSHLVDGKVVATENTRTVTSETGSYFASGEIKWKTGKKQHRRTHQQSNGDRLVRYQRMDGGPKAPGVRIFEWEGQMRLAWLNGSGKPVDLGGLETRRIWDGPELLHLVAHWGLPRACRSGRISYLDIGTQKTGEASLTCVGSKRMTDDDKRPLEVNVFTLEGVPGDAAELWVDGQGALIGAKYGARTMLRAKFAIEGSREVAPGDADGDDEDKKAIKERGVGE